MKKDLKIIAGRIAGIALAGAALLANQLGADNDATWGAKRLVLFSFGVFIFLVFLLYRENNMIGKSIHTQTGQLYLAAAITVGAIVLLYLWISIRTWTPLPKTTNYYDLLARAFNHGQLALELQPDPALLAIEDPYNPKNREAFSPALYGSAWNATRYRGKYYLLDATLYRGKYYLYWGPAPALALAIVKFFYARAVGDNILILFFITGLFIFQTLIILEFWRNYFIETPRWIILFSVALAGLINPIPYILFEPRIYEAAIASGQFFLMGGFFWLFVAFNKPSVARLTLAGIFFAFAMLSRTTLVFPIAFIALVVIVWALKEFRDKALTFIGALIIPIALGALSYAWYNYMRFGAITEFGLRYQLTASYVYEDLGAAFSLAYIPPNLFKTLVNPLRIISAFPFITPTHWTKSIWFDGYLPKIYNHSEAENITGILVSSPFLIFAFLVGADARQKLRWILRALIGSTLLIFFTLQIFFYVAMRYLLDVVPALSLLALIGFWQGLRLLQSRRIARRLFAILGMGLGAYTIAVSFIISVSSHSRQNQIFNPDLLQRLTWTFNYLFK